MIISLIVPAFNEERYLGKILDAINNSLSKTLLEKQDWEIIVCDNNSTDKTSDIASGHGAKVLFVEESQISLARNSGAKIADGDWLLFIDADTLPGRELMSEACDLTASEEYIGCGATVSIENGTLFNKLRKERLNPIFRLLNLCGGSFVLCKADAFHAIGGAMTRYKHYCYEQGKKIPIAFSGTDSGELT